MNPFQIAGVAGGCVLAFAGFVGLLTLQGVPVLLAFLTVYAVALLTMLAMQRRARQSCDAEHEACSVDERRYPHARGEHANRRGPEQRAGAGVAEAGTRVDPRVMGGGEIGC